MIARLAARFEAASLFILEEIDELRNSGFFNAEAFDTWVVRVHAGEPR